MARYHDVTVLTRSNNRAGIEKELALMGDRQPVPKFIYHDERRGLLWLKKRFRAVRLYYVFWQVSASRIIEQLTAEQDFDVLHHVTFAGFRYRTAIWNHGVPSVWGPVGGVESIPWRLLPWKHPSSLLPELARNVNNFIQSAPFHVLPKRAQTTTATLVSTEEMERTFLHLGLEATLMPTIGLNIQPMQPRVVRNAAEPLKLLFVGNVITLKGIDLAIQALQSAGVNATFTIVGDGKFSEAAKRLVNRLGLESQVLFRGRLTRAETLKLYPDYDVFVFPSLHDTGGYAVIEAMACGLPVICLDCGGPRVTVKNGAGIRIPLGSRGRVIRDLAGALRKYDSNRELVVQHGLAAREVILREYDWNKKGEELNEIYLKVATEKTALQSEKGLAIAGILRRILTRLFPVRGLTVSALILLVIGTAGFLSVDHLKRHAAAIVQDTLPELSLVGAANSSMAEGFNRTLLMLMADTPEERSGYRQEMTRFSEQSTKSLSLYERVRFAPVESAIYKEVMESRQKYAISRQQVLDLVDQAKPAEAVALCRTAMVPDYLAYKGAAEKLLKFNAHEGKSNGETILRICTITQYVVAGVGVLLFVVGFTIGLLK
jgi:glycosyltransferase involved in cell wall biosynthesis